MATSPAETTHRAGLVRRATLLLILAQAALWGALGTFAAQAPVAIDEVSGRPTVAGLLLAVFSVALGLGARGAGRLMDRAGRRPGLLLGYVVLGAGGGAAFAAVRLDSLSILFVAVTLLGVGAAAAQLGRAAVADMYPPEQRGRAVGALIVAGTVGAVGGPPLGSLVHTLAEPLGGTTALALPWLLIPVLAVVALSCVAAVRPDPKALAVEADRAPGAGRPPRAILRLAPGAAAAVTIGLSQATMTTFMTIVPLSIHQHGATQTTISAVVSFHLAGMFAFSPVIGSILDRWGRRRGLLAGLAVLVTGVGLCAFARPTGLVSVGLFLVGLGWSAAYLGSTAVVSDLTVPSERGSALGLTDLITGLAAAGGVLAGSALVEAAGIGALGVAVLALLAVPISLQARLREPVPGRWVTQEG